MMEKLFFVTIIVPIILLIACGSPQSGATEQPTQQVTLQEIKNWSGTGIKTTEPFTIESSPWAIAWAHEPQVINGQSMGILQIMVYKTSNPNIPITLAANSNTKASEVSYIYESGQFFLTINAANTNWALKVLAK